MLLPIDLFANIKFLLINYFKSVSNFIVLSSLMLNKSIKRNINLSALIQHPISIVIF